MNEALLAILILLFSTSVASAQTSAPMSKDSKVDPQKAAEEYYRSKAPQAPAVTRGEDMWVHRGAKGWVMEREFASTAECQAFAKQYAEENKVPVGCKPHRDAPAVAAPTMPGTTPNSRSAAAAAEQARFEAMARACADQEHARVVVLPGGKVRGQLTLAFQQCMAQWGHPLDDVPTKVEVVR